MSIDLTAAKAAVSLPDLLGHAGVKLKRSGRIFMACCPFHDDRTPSLAIWPDHFHCYGCGAHGDALDWLMRTRGVTLPEAARFLLGKRERMPEPHASVRAQTRERDGEEVRRRIAIAKRIWREAVDPRGSIVEAYLATRGLCLPTGAPIRFHPRCPCGDERRPAMVAAMSDAETGKGVGVHRTFLKADGAGKADVERPKRMLGSAGIVRLAPDDEAAEGLGLSEGIETGLAVMQHFGWRPVWAACSRDGIEQFPVLPGTLLTIFADGDAVGLDAARACADRWAAAGHETTIVVPPAGTDWNDRAPGVAA